MLLKLRQITNGVRTTERLLSLWPTMVLCAAIVVAFSPNVFYVSGIHNNYEAIVFQSGGILHSEAMWLFEIARPVAALLSNLTMLPVESVSDYRWVRLFSIMTVCVLALSVVIICIGTLRIALIDATIFAAVMFLVPAFTYSVLDASAWAPHLLSILLTFGAYAVLGRSNVQAIAFLVSFEKPQVGPMIRQARAYLTLRSVVLASVFFQLALFDYPSNALILTVVPVIVVLSSRLEWRYRMLIAGRDLMFMGLNLIVYFLSAKILYLPAVRFVTNLLGEAIGASNSPFAQKVGNTYSFTLSLDAASVLNRTSQLMRVAGDLWFLPQTQFHLAAAAVIIIGAALAIARASPRFAVAGRCSSPTGKWPAYASTLAAGAVIAISFILAASPVLFSSGGIISYRTTAAPTALAAVVFVVAAKSVVENLRGIVGSSVNMAFGPGQGLMALMGASAFAATLYANVLTARLAANERAYATAIVRQALNQKSNVLVVIDPRPVFLPEHVVVAYDARGRWLPPYELGCFSGYCLQTGAIFQVIASELSATTEALKVWVVRNDYPVPNLTCEILTVATPPYPPGSSRKSMRIVDYYRSLAPLTCVNYNLAWRDLAAKPEEWNARLHADVSERR